MCGIAGIVDLTGRRRIDPARLKRMADTLWHRGPDEDGYLHETGVAFASRRLSIVGLADGRQPLFNEDRSVAVVFNGELFDYPEKRAALEAAGHRFRTSCDTEILVHLWEDQGPSMLEALRGQFAFALYDFRKRFVMLARDRLGICPLFWSRQGDWLYFGSEIKALLASGQVPREADVRGIDHIFTFFAMGTRRTAFAGISAVAPGHALHLELGSDARPAAIHERQYWDLDFPALGDEYDPQDPARLLEEFDAVFRRAVEIRLRADVPVVGYLSGGVDSTSVVATASQLRKAPLRTFTIRIDTPRLDETDRALLAAKTVGSEPTVITCDGAAIAQAYPKLIAAAEAPVMDTSCAALYCLAAEVRRQGFKAALTGEGADEALAGYAWFKTNRLLRLLDVGAFRPSNLFRRAFLKLTAPHIPWSNAQRIQEMIGGPHAGIDLYGLVSLSRSRFYTQSMYERIGGHIAYEDLDIPLDRLKHWHPLNQSLYLGYKTMLPGLLMNHKGDRPAMANSVETRYPFLDEAFVDFCAKLHPRWKLHGIRRDKHLLRTYAAGMLPRTIADRPKAMFRAPFADTFFEDPPPFVDQLLSDASLRRTGYFDPERVARYRKTFRQYRWGSGKRLTLEMGLTGVMATQLWHHTFLGGGLCELPQWAPPPGRPLATAV